MPFTTKELLKDELSYIKNHKGLFEQKLIQIGQCQTRSSQKHSMDRRQEDSQGEDVEAKQGNYLIGYSKWLPFFGKPSWLFVFGCP